MPRPCSARRPRSNVKSLTVVDTVKMEKVAANRPLTSVSRGIHILGRNVDLAPSSSPLSSPSAGFSLPVIWLCANADLLTSPIQVPARIGRRRAAVAIAAAFQGA